MMCSRTATRVEGCMSSSVSSERAFSQGGLNITKRRNRLKGDIVEALQGLKCAVGRDVLFREPAPSSTLEAEHGEDSEDSGEGSEATEGWNNMVMEDEDDGLGMDIDIY
jgi:hAT family C-terminal dimerisation region